MTASSTTPAITMKQMSKTQRAWFTFKKNWMLHSLMVLPMLYYVLFEAFPLYGLQIAFRDYSVVDGIFGSAWIGLDHYVTFFEYYKWKNVVLNTVILSCYSIVASFPVPIILALLIHVNQHKVLKKITQNVSYIPHFISTVVLIGLLQQILNPIYGLIGSLYKLFGIYTGAPDLFAMESAFRHLYVWSGVWQNMGWSTIVYVAALSGVSAELHEAAKIDGATRLRRVFSVDLPAIMPTVTIMLIMRFGSIMSVGYEKVYLMQKTQNINVSEIISTYVYKNGIMNGKQSFGTAIGLLNSVINSAMTILVNKIANWMSDGEAGLF